MKGLSPRSYIPSLVEFCPVVPEKIFEIVFTIIYGRRGHLGHVAKMPRTNFVPPTYEGSTQTLALIGKAVSEEKMLEIVNERTDTHALGRRDGRRIMRIRAFTHISAHLIPQ